MRRGGERRATLRLLHAVGALLMAWLLTAGVLVAARTWVHSVRTLTFGQTVLAALLLALVAWMMRAAWTVADGSPSDKLPPLLLTSLGLAIWGASLTWRSGSPAAALFFWLVVGAEEGWAWWKAVARRRGVRVAGRPASAPGNRVLQQLTRALTADGAETIHGTITITVERGSRSAAGHVSFCPPFAERPRFEMQPVGEKNAVLKLSQLFPHGARIELKLPQPAQQATMVPVQFVARARSDRENGPLAL